MSRILVFVFVIVSLTACSKHSSAPTSTESGPLGEVDLAPKLPSGVTVSQDVKSYDARRTVCPGAKADAPLDVRIRWKSFTKDGTSYIASYAVEIVKPSPGVSVQLEKEPSVQTVTPPNASPMTVAKATVRCTSRPAGTSVVFEETATIYIRSDGTSSQNPVW